MSKTDAVTRLSVPGIAYLIPISFCSVRKLFRCPSSGLIVGACPGAQHPPYHLTMALEIIGKNRCSRWHQDNYTGRTIIT